MTTTASAIGLPFEEAIRFFRDKANVTTKTWTDVYAAAHSRAFMVAGAATDAIVADFRAAVDKAISQGTTLDEFRKDFDTIVERYGWSHTGGRNWRSRVIFDTNLKTAYAAGRYAELTRPETLAAFPFWQYNHSGALHPRLDHLSWDGLTLAAEDPFWKTNYPPNGWGCGCSVIPSSRRDLRRQGKSGPDPSPDLVFRAEEVGGRTVRVPTGVDPGFEYNPGMAWQKRTAPGSVTVAAAPGLIARFVQTALRDAGALPAKSWVPVARLPPEVSRSLNVELGSEVRLSVDTINRHRHHPEATPEVYAEFVERALEEGELYLQNMRLQLIMEDEQGFWLAGLKRTTKGEIYLTTLHRSRLPQIEKIRRQGRLLKKGTRAGGP